MSSLSFSVLRNKKSTERHVLRQITSVRCTLMPLSSLDNKSRMLYIFLQGSNNSIFCVWKMEITVWKQWVILFDRWSRVTTHINYVSFIFKILLYDVFVTAVIVNMSMTTSINSYISFRFCVLVIHRTITISGLASLFCYRYSWSRRKGLVVISPFLSLKMSM